jgi:hypothetical protein
VTLIWATYLGGTGSEEIAGVDVDQAGNIHISGNTFSSDLPTTAGAQRTALQGTSDGWYSILSPDLTGLKFSTLFGGSDKDRGRERTCHAGYTVISGDTLSNDFPTTKGAVQARYSGSNDGILLRFQKAPREVK